MLYYFIFISTYFSTTLAFVDIAVVGGNNAQCTGASVTLQCALMGDVLIWLTPHGAINLFRGRENDINSHYHAHLMEVNASHLRSTLNFNFTAQITISCSDTTAMNSTTIIVEGPPSAPDRPLTTLDRIRRLNKTFSSVTVVWNIPDTNNAHISSYVVTVDPPIPLPASGVIAADNPLFQSQQLTLTLLHGQQYYITVRAKSCDDSVEGAVSAALSMRVQVPEIVERCSALPVYDYFSNSLKRIEMEWDAINDTGEFITAGISASVKKYIITTAPIGVDPLEINSTLGVSDICTGSTCRYFFKSTNETSSPYVSVYVTAKNILHDGYGESQSCSKSAISLKNNILSVNVNEKSGGTIEVLCRHFGDSHGTNRCDIVSRLLPTNTSNVTISTAITNESDYTLWSVSFRLSSTFLSIEAYSVGGAQNVAVHGIFKTGKVIEVHGNMTKCSTNNTGNDEIKQEDITNRSSNDSVLVCSCESPDSCLTTTAIAFMVLAASIISIISCLIGGLFYHISIHCWNSKKSRKAEKPHAIYDEIAPAKCDAPNCGNNSHEEVVTHHNKAYANIQHSGSQT